MELPAELKIAVDRLLDGTPLSDLRRAAQALSARYRAEIRDGRLHVGNHLAARAYLATRLPATYAAIRASLAHAADLLPDFAPKSMLDVGSGPGTAVFAAADCWPTLEKALLVEKSPAMRQVAGEIATKAMAIRTEWVSGDAEIAFPESEGADLVTAAYLLDEIDPRSIGPLVERLWSLAKGMLVIVEPGTSAGWQRILAVRRMLIAAGAHIVAPCPHDHDCPLVQPDWCHFARRVARSRLHRQAKDADVPWEDEKYIFLAASRSAPKRISARVLAPPRQSSGVVRLKLCTADGSVSERTVSRREGTMFKSARRLDWGDALPGGRDN
ncbi:MAG TPA: small ribosomal subunit Rsm22 family protein [Rhizobiaceae bacterium]|nr:small ribosomal subunit Rsm22 family protein [Rhizobiaceae bacterium]